MSGSPIPQTAVATDFPGKTLGIVALVAVFFAAVVGLILGYVARNQSKAAGYANTPAKVAIILGWVFIGLVVVIWVVVAILGAVASSST